MPIVCAAALACLIFGIVSASVVVRFDHVVTDVVVAHRTPMLNAVETAMTMLGSEVTLVLLTLVTTGILWWRHARDEAAFVLIAMLGSATLTVVVKNLVKRPRPPVADVLGAVLDPTYSFPSGHTLNSAVFLAAVLVVTMPSLRTRLGRLALVSLGIVLAVGVGLSRVYVGFHWLSDVIGSWLIAAIWVSVLSFTFRQRTARGRNNGRVSRPSHPVARHETFG